MQKLSDESKMQQIYKMLDKIDDDRDGKIEVEDVLKVNRCFIHHHLDMDNFNIFPKIFLRR